MLAKNILGRGNILIKETRKKFRAVQDNLYVNKT